MRFARCFRPRTSPSALISRARWLATDTIRPSRISAYAAVADAVLSCQLTVSCRSRHVGAQAIFEDHVGWNDNVSLHYFSDKVYSAFHLMNKRKNYQFMVSAFEKLQKPSGRTVRAESWPRLIACSVACPSCCAVSLTLSLTGSL